MIKLRLIFLTIFKRLIKTSSVFYYGMVVVWLWSGIYRLNCQSEFINVSNRKQQGVWHFFGLEIFTFQIMTTNFPKKPTTLLPSQFELFAWLLGRRECWIRSKQQIRSLNFYANKLSGKLLKIKSDTTPLTNKSE